MAVFQKDPFPGTDYSRYLEWVPVHLPSGEIVYEVPGHPGYVFDPVASNATGRKVFRPNPKRQIEEQAKAQAQQDKLAKQQAFNQSPAGQVLPAGLAIGGTYAAAKLAQPGVSAVALTPQGVLMSDGTIKATHALGNAAAQGATSTAANTGVQSLANGGVGFANGGATTGFGPVANADAYGAGLNSSGASTAGAQSSGTMFGSGGSLFNTNGMLGAEGTFAPLNIAGGAIGTYGVYKASQMQNKRQGVASGAASGALAGMSVGGPVGAGIGAVVGGLAGLAANESTKHRSKRRYGELQSLGGDSKFQSMMSQGLQEDLSGADTWDRGDDKSKAPIDLLTRSYGVLKTFGPQWANVDPAKRQEIVRKLVENDLINSKQGSYLVDNPQAAQDIFNSVMNGASSKPTTPAEAAAKGATTKPNAKSAVISAVTGRR